MITAIITLVLCGVIAIINTWMVSILKPRNTFTTYFLYCMVALLWITLIGAIYSVYLII